MNRRIIGTLIAIAAIGIAVFLVAPSDGESGPSRSTTPTQLTAATVRENQGTQATSIPTYVTDVLAVIDRTGTAPSGYQGGRTFSNDGRGNGERLPQRDDQGSSIRYREWDVHPYQRSVNRGAERLVTGSDGSAYFTEDHYDSFEKLR
jgi:guanyl-specific ribonuclease Sa